MQYAVQFISLTTMDYCAVWWQIFHAPTASEWSNALTLVQLLFSLPASNGKLEKVFSQMNIIKTNKRSVLSNESLDDLLLLSIKGPPMKEFSPNAAINLWWKEKLRRPHLNPRRKYKNRSGSNPPAVDRSSDESDEEEDLLAQWDAWM